MDPNNMGNEDVAQVFELIQDSSACHLKYAITLKRALETYNDEFLEEFIRCMHATLLADYSGKNVYVERVINFIVLLCTSLVPKNDDTLVDNPVLHHILTNLLECSNLAIESCRYWSCKLINRILEKVEEVNDDLYEQVREAMLERLKDAKAAIRLEAIASLYRLQDPTDTKDPIMRQFCHIIDCDFNAKVRQLITEKIAVTKDSLPLIVNRVRDVDANVRLTAFQKLCPLVKFLKVSQRRLIIQCGFLDSSQKVKSFVSTQLLESWLKTYNNNYLQLMESIRLDACEEDIKKTTALVEFILNASFKSKSVQDIVCNIKLNPQKLIEYENLNWESVLYYRIVTQFFRRSEEFEEVLFSILPELVAFCKYIKGYCDFVNGKLRFDMLEYYFILQQFFLITQEYDLSDTASRKCLNSLAHHMLQNIELTADVAECVMQNLEKTILSTEDLSIFVCEIISNIMYGDDDIDYEALHQEETKRQQSISQLKADISELREKEDQCIFEKRFLDAQQIKCDIEKKQAELESVEMVQIKTEPTERKTDVPTIVKYLTVAEGLLRLPSIKRLNPALATLCSEVIQKVIPHESDKVKAKAFKCYGLCCVIDKKCASYGIHIFSAPIFSSRTLEDCDSEILSTCIKVVVDLLCIYGLSLVDKTEESELSDSRKEDEKKVFVGGTSLADLIGGLADLLEHEDPQIQEITTKGICILLLHNRVTSSSLLSRIILKWANPATDNESLKQFIGFTLNALPSLPSCHTYIGDAVLSTIKTLIYAPKTSALSDVNIENIIKFMITLCQMSPRGLQIQSDLALKICSQLIDGKPRVKVNNVFAKTLLLLTLPENMEILDDLILMCDQLVDVIRDNQTLRNITKFNATLIHTKIKLSPKEE